MNKKRIIISVTSDLCTDQRVQKVAKTLQKGNFDVLLIGRKLLQSPDFESSLPNRRFQLLFNRGPLFYAEYNIRLFLFLLFQKADIFLSNDTDTLLANFFASKIRRKKLVFDAHELFPEVPEVVHRKWVKAIWTGIENFIFPKLTFCYTVSQSIADYYNKKYRIAMQVIRNVPDKIIERQKTNKDKTLAFENKKIILYQGALNIGRGLEWIINAMPYIDNAILVIIGEGDISDELRKKVTANKVSEKVVFLGRINGKKLKEYTLCADVGLCLLENKGLSYYYSLPNRIFDYMQAGVPVLASNFPEIATIVNSCKSGMLIDYYEPQYIAQVIAQMLTDYQEKDRTRIKKQAENFSWENEEAKLLAIFTS